MSLFLNFGNGGHFRLKWRFILISLSINFQKWFYCIFDHGNLGIELIYLIVSLIVMIQFIIFGDGGHFRLKRGFPRLDFGIKKFDETWLVREVTELQTCFLSKMFGFMSILTGLK